MPTLAANLLQLREWISERDTTVVPDATLQNYYLQAGAEALNERVGYFFKTDTLTLVDGDESTLPTDLIEVVWITVDGKLLKPVTVEELNQQVPAWRDAAKGLPKEFYVYSKIGFHPAPDAAAVALTSKIRYLATPTISTSPGFDLLASQHHRIPVLYAAALWFEAHGLDGDSFRADRFRKQFEEEAARVAAYYERRRMARGI